MQPTDNSNLAPAVELVKQFRKDVDALIVRSEYMMGRDDKNADDATVAFIRDCSAREVALVRTKLQEAKMWAGKILETMGNPFPPELADKAEAR